MAHRCFTDAEAGYFRCLEAERQGLTGTTAEYYSLRRAANVDPLYAEPASDPLYGGPTQANGGVGWAFLEPFDVVVTVEFQEVDNREPTAVASGQEIEYDALMRLAVNTWTAAAPAGVLPKEDDVVVVFGHHWDVVKASRAGNVLDTPLSVGWTLGLKRRESFAPERRIP